ncbi:hypothetical protein HMPREF0742_01394 [Rothia aeria F0184]|uniref:Uncharacterized protein n=1 Tax=Rothia aeria F0184 TaxID=888019 RepID=U7V384_9MICC|nr:hypothetical protein HMPREF0742_01394 [Rothia aeria F0184]
MHHCLDIYDVPLIVPDSGRISRQYCGCIQGVSTGFAAHTR